MTDSTIRTLNAEELDAVSGGLTDGLPGGTDLIDSLPIAGLIGGLLETVTNTLLGAVPGDLPVSGVNDTPDIS
ncbi:hypothetical protein A8U91_04013 [Halomonas elongata]|uniref:Uncharacterized protein n=1 Tax=Halomonas elongata TaxID=2746 RepID=A0A1B8NY79_HALEL|nr:hypothetical protein [Halomonas elongata]OBX34950.1 hypothetical protein A8U91_04013 [Halomonas elongata]